MPLRLRFWFELLTCALALVVYAVWASATAPLGYLGDDTEEYRQFASALADGHLLRSSDNPNVTLGELRRSPGYPLLLYLSTFFPGDLYQQVSTLHAAWMVAAFLLAALILRPHAAPWMVCAAAIPPIFQLRDLFHAQTTEWTSLWCIVVWGALWSGVSSELRTPHALALGAISALAALIRPALCVLFLTALIAVVLSRKATSKNLLALLLGFMPALVWMSVNLYRVNAFTLAPIEGFALYNAASLIGVPKAEEESTQQRQFNQHVRAQQEIATVEELLTAWRFEPTALLEHASRNYSVARSYAEQSHLPWLATNRLMRSYSIAVLREQPLRYLLYLTVSACSAIYILPIALTLVILLKHTSANLAASLGWSAGMLVALHLAHVFLVSTTQPLLPRYFVLTFFPAVWGVLLVGIGWALKVFRTAK